MIGQHGIVWQHGRLPTKAIVFDFQLSDPAFRLRQFFVGFVEVSRLLLDEPPEPFDFFRLLESCFGLFKELERQHSKGGFTSLRAAFGALLKPATPESIRADFARVSVKQMRTWVSENLGTTLTSKRQTA